MSKLGGLHLSARAAALPWPLGAPQEREAPRKDILMAAARGELTAAWKACGAFEWAAFHYLALSSVLIAIFSRNLEHPARLVGTQFSLAAGILLLCGIYARAEKRAAANGPSLNFRFWHFWRHWYPHLFFLFCFEEMAHLVHMVFPGWFDAKLIAADMWITGVNPVLWIQRFSNPPLNEFMQFIYTSYFTYLLILGGILYFRKDWKGYWSVMTYSMVGYQIGYVIAACFPIQSPWFQLAGQWPTAALDGGPITALINFIEHYGRVRGAAFPSQHVCGAVAAVWGAWAHRRRVFWVFLPMVFFMCISTVYGRYHYMVDIFGGITTGTIGYWLGGKLMQRDGAIVTEEVKS
jgi:membrane-associated phospholipid phosphatase